MKQIAFTAKEFDDREADGIGATRRTGRENAVRASVDGRSAEQFISFRAIEHPENEQVRETFNVGEAGFELRKYFERAFGLVLGTEPLGDFFGAGVWTLHVADGLRGEHGSMIAFSE